MTVVELISVLNLVLALMEAVAILAIARTIGAMQLSLGGEPGPLVVNEGLSTGAEAPPLSADREISDLNIARPLLLVFMSADCSVCRQLAKHSPMTANQIRERAQLLFVIKGSNEQVAEFASLARGISCLADPTGDVTSRYQVERTPFAFLVLDGRIARKGVPNTPEQLEMLADIAFKLRDHAWSEHRIDEVVNGGVSRV